MSRILKFSGLALGLLIIIFLSYSFIIRQPSNNLNWEVGMEQVPHITIDNQIINISNLRDYHYDSRGITEFNYLSRQIDTSKVTQVWLVVEPFTQFKQVAHTYFIFDFSDQPPVAVSVEARREKNEPFNAFVGAFNQYELIYLWGTETDETIRRVTLEHNHLYMYPLTISPAAGQNLLLQLAKNTQDLAAHPRFYNTLTSNCTNELAKAANAIKPGAIPWNWALIFPGYTAEQLYKLKYLPTNQSLSQLTPKSDITQWVEQLANQPDFSSQLRQHLQTSK